MKMEDYQKEVRDLQARKIQKIEKVPPCWCPVCRELVAEDDIDPFREMVDKKTQEYRLVLKKKEEEARRMEEKWKREVELEAESGEVFQPVTTISSIFD